MARYSTHVRIRFETVLTGLCMQSVHAMVPGQRSRTAKPCKGETRVFDAIIGTYQLREIPPTENPRSSIVAGGEHKASNLVS